jgi:hypothetical protein
LRRIRKWDVNHCRLVKPVHHGAGSLRIDLRNGEQGETAQRVVLEEMRSLRQRRRAIEDQHKAAAGRRWRRWLIGHSEAGLVHKHECRQVFHGNQCHPDRLGAALHCDFEVRADLAREPATA